MEGFKDASVKMALLTEQRIFFFHLGLRFSFLSVHNLLFHYIAFCIFKPIYPYYYVMFSCSEYLAYYFPPLLTTAIYILLLQIRRTSLIYGFHCKAKKQT